MNGKLQEVLYHSVEINVTRPGQKVSIEQPLPLLFDQVEGVAIIHPGGKQGQGKLSLSIGGETIFPDGFHAGAFMHHTGNSPKDELVSKEIDTHLYNINEKAKGATIKATYCEPEEGSNGVLYLVFKLTKNNKC